MSGQAPLGVSGGLDGDDNYDFEALYSSIEASIDRKKEKTHQNRSDVNVIQTTVEELNNRCAVLGRRIERERQERCQDTTGLRQTIQEEIKSLQDVIAHEKYAQEEREEAAQHLFSDEKQKLDERMDEQKKYLESAIAYVRTQVEGEKMARSNSENKLLTALQEVSVQVQVSMTTMPLEPQVRIFKDLESRVNSIEMTQNEKAGRPIDMLLNIPEGHRCLLPGPGTCFTPPAPSWKAHC